MTAPLLEARDLVVRRNGLPILDGLDLTLRRGETVQLAGASGSGKSTLLLGLALFLPRGAGRLALEGEDEEAVPPHLWRARVALLPQVPVQPEGSVRGNLLLPWRFRVRRHSVPPDDAVLRRGLDRLGLEGVALDGSARELSGGQQARLAYLRLLLTSPRVLLLDEPTAQLDPDSEGLVMASIAEFAGAGGAALVVRHGRPAGGIARSLQLVDGVLREAS